jgi:hypothetical protein
MSDGSQGTTQVMEPQGSSGVPSPPATALGGGSPGGGGSGSGVPVWLVVVLVVAAAFLAGGGAYALLRTGSPTAGTGTAVTTPTVVATAQVAATPTPVPVPPKPPTPSPSKPPPVALEPAIVKSVWLSSGVWHIKVDYVQWLTGAAAAAAATAHGDESPPPNDFYVVNDSTLLRTFTLPSSAVIKVLDWGSATGTTLTQITRAQFHGVLNASHPEYTQGIFWLTVVDSTKVTIVKQQYIP